MRFAAFWALLGFAAMPAMAQSSAQRVDIQEFVAEALRRNPEVLAAQKRYEAARQRPAQERSLPDPMVSFGWNSSGNPLPLAGVGTEPVANIGIMATQEIPYPGKLRLKAEVAAKEAGAEAQQFRAVQLNVVSRVKQAFFRLQHAWAMLDLIERNRDLLRSLLRTTEARYSVGKAAQSDVFKAQTQLTLIDTRQSQLERELRTREAEMNALLHRAPGSPVGRPAEPHMTPLSFELDDLLARVPDAAPMLARDQKMIERAQTALSLAKKEFYPDFAFNGGYYYMGSMPRMYMFRADVKLPIRLGRRRAEVTERANEVAEARHAYEATAQSLHYRIRDEYLAAQTAEKLTKLYAETIIPQARFTIQSSLAAYETGTTEFLSVLMNHVAVVEYEMNYHEQMQEFHLALTRLEEMAGVELTE
jgi:outer membrane protein TolC